MSQTDSTISCGRCSKPISPSKKTKLPQCSSCKVILHFNCSSIAAKSWRYLADQPINTWKCVDCENRSLRNINNTDKNSRKHSNTVSPTSSPEQETNSAKRPKKAMDEAALKAISDILDRKLEPLFARFDSLENKIGNFETKIFPSIIADVKTHDVKIEALQQQVAQLEQYTRRNSLVLSGIPMAKNYENNSMEVVLAFAEKVGFPLTKKEIDATHRLYRNMKNEPQPLPLLVKFVSRATRTEFLIHCRKLKPTAALMGGPADTLIYVNEHLTRQTSELLRAAKVNLKPLQYKITTIDGIVIASLPNGRKVKIMNKDKLQELMTIVSQPQQYGPHSSSQAGK